MGKGRLWPRALRSNVTPTGRWAPKSNSHAICVGTELYGKTGGGRMGVRTRFIAASKSCRGK